MVQRLHKSPSIVKPTQKLTFTLNNYMFTVSIMHCFRLLLFPEPSALSDPLINILSSSQNLLKPFQSFFSLPISTSHKSHKGKTIIGKGFLFFFFLSLPEIEDRMSQNITTAITTIVAVIKIYLSVSKYAPIFIY